jgi:2,3-bisphosphoglycerate-dependent phosphoglycerate mutase
MIVLQRHFEPSWPLQRCLGQYDAPLSALGVQQACSAAHKNSQAIAELWSSDLQRARDSAQPLSQRCGVAIKQSPLLRELDMGCFTGLAWDEVHRRFPEALKHWGEHWHTHGPPAGESFKQLVRRTAAWRDVACSSGLIWAVTHEGFMRAALVAWRKESPEQAMQRRFAYGEELHFA